MGDVDIAEATAERVLAFIDGSGPVTRSWHRKHEVLRGFYRFARARGCIAASPLPTIIPQATQFVPHVFSQEELRRLLAITRCCQNLRSKLQPYTLRMLILLSYGTGLRISEALSLTLADVDLSARILTIRESKFFCKTRSVPLGRLPPSANPRRRRAPRPLSAATSRPEACLRSSSPDFLVSPGSRRATPAAPVGNLSRPCPYT